MNGKMSSFFTIWEITDKDNYADVKMQTGRKVNETYDKTLIENNVAKKGYVNTTWFVRFVGKAYNQLKKYDVDAGTRITNVSCNVSMEPYWDKEENTIKYPKNPKITIYEFELANTESGGYDKAPVVEEEKEIETNTETTDEYPF